MFVVTVTFVAKPDALAAFLPLMQDNARQSLAQEPGCHRFDICRAPERPNEVFLYELYKDAAAFEAHKSMPHYMAFTEATVEMIEAKTVKTYALMEA